MIPNFVGNKVRVTIKGGEVVSGTVVSWDDKYGVLQCERNKNMLIIYNVFENVQTVYIMLEELQTQDDEVPNFEAEEYNPIESVDDLYDSDKHEELIEGYKNSVQIAKQKIAAHMRGMGSRKYRAVYAFPNFKKQIS